MPKFRHFFAREERVSEHTSVTSVHTAQSAVCEGGLALTKAGLLRVSCVPHPVVFAFQKLVACLRDNVFEMPDVVRTTPCPALGGGETRDASVWRPGGCP